MGIKVSREQAWAGRSAFQSVCVAAGLPEPVPEYRFDDKRKWQVDWFFEWVFVRYSGFKLALEVEGAVWKQGRHTRGSGFVKDVEKYNALAVAGIWLLRCTPKQMASGEAVQLVKAFAEARGLLLRGA